MLYTIIRTSLIACYFTVVANVLAELSKTCPGGEMEGETSDMGEHWYLCQDGKLIMKGCLSETKLRLEANETYVSKGYLIECTEDTSGVFSFTYKICHSESGEEKSINDIWQDKNYWYECVVVGQNVSAEIRGCIDNGKRYKLEEVLSKNNTPIECKRKDDGNINWEMSAKQLVQLQQTQTAVVQTEQQWQRQLPSQSEQHQQQPATPSSNSVSGLEQLRQTQAVVGHTEQQQQQLPSQSQQQQQQPVPDGQNPQQQQQQSQSRIEQQQEWQIAQSSQEEKEEQQRTTKSSKHNHHHGHNNHHHHHQHHPTTISTREHHNKNRPRY